MTNESLNSPGRAPHGRADSRQGEDGFRCERCPNRSGSICVALGDEEIGGLKAVTRLVNFMPSQQIFHEREPGDHLFTIIAGTVKLYKLLPDGRRQIIGFPADGDFLGLGSVSGYPCAAEAVTPVTLCRISRADLLRLFDRLPKLDRRLNHLSAEKIIAAHDQILLLGRKTAVEKMATFLLARATRTAPGGREVTLPMSRQDIADYLGLTPETVSRTITRLIRERAIAVPKPDRFELCDRDALAAYAGLDPAPRGMAKTPATGAPA